MRNLSKKQTAGLFIIGAAAGAVVALLVAPKTGAQTRKDIRQFSKKTANRLDNMEENLRDQINEGYEQVLQVFDNVKEYVEDGRNRLKKIIKTA